MNGRGSLSNHCYGSISRKTYVVDSANWECSRRRRKVDPLRAEVGDRDTQSDRSEAKRTPRHRSGTDRKRRAPLPGCCALLLTLSLLTFTDVICDRGAASCAPSSCLSTPASSPMLSEACAGVWPSKLLQLSFGALLKMDTVFADRWASGPSVARRATGPAWARCSALRQRVCGFMEHGCGQALSVHLHEVKEWSASGQPCRGLQGSGWGQPVGSMHRCTELPCGPQAPESTRSCDT